MTPEQIRDYAYPGVYKRYERHTIDVDRSPIVYKAPETYRGAKLAWVAMGVLVALYVVWKCWK
jgi:hypothetical protein